MFAGLGMGGTDRQTDISCRLFGYWLKATRNGSIFAVIKVGLCRGSRAQRHRSWGCGPLRVIPSALRPKPEHCGDLGPVEERLRGPEFSCTPPGSLRPQEEQGLADMSVPACVCGPEQEG